MGISSERFFVNPFSLKEFVGGTEVIGDQYCKALDLRFISARTVGIKPEGSDVTYVELCERLDNWLRSVPRSELVIRNSVIGMTFDKNKPIIDEDIVLCFEHFDAERKSVPENLEPEWSKERIERFNSQKKSIECADKILVLSEIEKELFKESGYDVTVVEPYVDTKMFNFDEKRRAEYRDVLGIPDDKKIAIYAGREHFRKGFDTVIRAARQLPEINFLCAMSHSVLYSKSNLPRNILWGGELHQEELNAAYNAADVMFMPSRYESFGLVYAEAMVCGLPVVGYATGLLGKPDEFKDYCYIQTGEYTKDGQIELLKKALKNPRPEGLMEYARKRFAREKFEERIKSVLNV